MKLKALRASEVGCFAKPVELSGFDSGLNLFVGDNETGKSTLVRALKTVFSEVYRTKSKKLVQGLQPFGRGAPLIEVDFEVGDTRWRLRKQYLSSAFAELIVQDKSGAVREQWRNGDAENRLAELLQSCQLAGNMQNLFWLDQQDALSDQSLDANNQARIHDVLEQQVKDLSKSDRFRAVQAEILDDLDRYTTKETRRIKKNSDWDQARRDKDEARAALDEAEAKHRQLEMRKAEHAALTKRLDLLTSGEEREKRTAQLAIAKKTFETLKTARDALSSARQDSAAKEAICRHAETNLNIFTNRMSDFASVQKRIVETEKTGLSLSDEIKKAHTHWRDIENGLKEKQTKLDLYRASLANVANRALYVQTKIQVDALEDRLKKARALVRERANLQRVLANHPALDDTKDLLDERLRECELLEGRLAAGAPKLRVRYDQSNDQAILFDGKTLQDGVDVVVTEPGILRIPGIGDVEIFPGGKEGAGDDARELAAKQQAVAQLLADLGAKSIDDAYVLVGQRRETLRTLDDIEQNLRRLAPEGLEQLEASRDAARDQCGGETGAEASFELPAALQGATQDEIQGKVAALEFDVQTSQADVETARGAVEALKSQAAQTEASLTEQRRRSAELEKDLPPIQEREMKREDLVGHVGVAQEELARANQREARLQTQAGDTEEFSKSEIAFKAAETLEEDATREVQRIRQEQARIEGGLAQDDRDGVEASLANRREAFDRASKRLRAKELHVNALKRLEDLFARQDAENRARFLAPVSDGMLPYVKMVFPKIGLKFSDGMTLGVIERNAQWEEVSSLSDGTREQLAILTRLGFAALISKSGEPVPLVLDDPLVYSDDGRLNAMFRALEKAATQHQVVVLSCREAAFDPLVATRLQLGNWTPQQTKLTD